MVMKNKTKENLFYEWARILEFMSDNLSKELPISRIAFKINTTYAHVMKQTQWMEKQGLIETIKTGRIRFVSKITPKGCNVVIAIKAINWEMKK